MTSRQLEISGRIAEPLYLPKGGAHYQVTTWEMRFSTLVDRMKAAGPERSFFYASGRASNEAGFLFQMLARLFGTNYVNKLFRIIVIRPAALALACRSAQEPVPFGSKICSTPIFTS